MGVIRNSTIFDPETWRAAGTRLVNCFVDNPTLYCCTTNTRLDIKNVFYNIKYNISEVLRCKTRSTNGIRTWTLKDNVVSNYINSNQPSCTNTTNVPSAPKWICKMILSLKRSGVSLLSWRRGTNGRLKIMVISDRLVSEIE